MEEDLTKTDGTAGTERYSRDLRRQFRDAQLQAGRIALLIYHRDGTAQIQLQPDSTWTIGRQPLADIFIDDRSLSRQHALLSTADGLWIEDLDSTNGVLVNGEAVERAALQIGDQVRLGAVTLALVASSPGERRSLEGHDRFVARINEEVARARQFGRPFAVMMLRSLESGRSHASLWCAEVGHQLREVDHAALYAESCLEVLLPEATVEIASELASRILDSAADIELACCIALYPRDATSAGALIDRCSRAVQRAGAGVHRLAAEPDPVPPEPPAERIVSTPMRELLQQADRVAKATIPVLILGETGSGKEVLARRIHAGGPRGSQKLHAVNCAAIPSQLIESTLFGHERGAFTGATERRKGVFEAAEGSTIFLDEIGELAPAVQAALLRALDTKRIVRVGATRELKVNVRVLAATHRDLRQMVEAGSFREDLLFRLNAMVLQIPPLRERREEIEPLARGFVAEAAERNRIAAPTIAPDALALLASWRWPGNIRELRNVIERAVVISQEGVITADELPAELRTAPARGLAGSASGDDAASDDASLQPDDEADFKQQVQRFECNLIVSALRACDWNQSAAARALRMSRRTLVHKMKAFGIRKLGFSAEEDR